MKPKPVVAIDIDGTLGDWHAHFIQHARMWTGRALPDAKDINPGLPLHKHLRMGKTNYRSCKLAFRQGGWKRSMPVYPGASQAISQIRRMRAEVWLCTTRPYLRYDTLDPDTRHWLRRNRIQFDGLIYGEHKYRDLVKIVGRERVLCVLDDLPEMCAIAHSLGLPTLIRTQPYNRHVKDYPRVDNLYDFAVDMTILISKYYAEDEK